MELHAEGGYSKVYINADRTEVAKVMPRYITENGTSHINYSAIIDLSVQSSFGGKIHGIPVVSHYEVDDDSITIHMPYYGEPLNDIRKNRHTPEFIVYIISRLCEILISLEHNGIQHTDLKPCNVLYNVATHEVTLIDYNIVSQRVVANRTKCAFTPAYGTWTYSSPEVVFYTRPSSTSPTWSIGLLLAYMYARYPLHSIYKMTSEQTASRSHWKKELQKAQDKYPDGFPLSNEHIRVMPREHVALYHKCMKWNPQHRPSLKEVYFDLRGFELCPDIPLISYPLVDANFISESTRFIVVSKLYHTSRITKTLHLFLRAVEIFQRSYTYDSPFTLFEHGCASFCLAVMLLGSFTFDMEFMDIVIPFWQLGPPATAIPRLKEALWYIGNRCKWYTLGVTADVMLLDHKADTPVNYDLIKTVLLAGPCNSSTIFKDIVEKQKVNVFVD